MHIRYNTTTKIWEKSTDMITFTPVQEHFMGGPVGIGTLMPDPLSMLDVTGNIYAIPVFAFYLQSATVAGAGDYVWDTEIFANANHFVRQAANTQIKILKGGFYWISAYVIAGGLAAGVRNDAKLYYNSAVNYLDVSLIPATPDGFATHRLQAIYFINANEYIKVGVAGGNRSGSPLNTIFSRLDIYRLN